MKNTGLLLLLATIIFAFTIFILMPVVSAECEVDYLSADDVGYKVEGASSTPYIPGEQINLSYHVYPSDTSQCEIGGDCGVSRYYDVYTTLEQSNITATILYVSGEKETRPVSSDVYEQFGNGKHLCFAVSDSTGIKKIKIGVSGYLPSTYSERLTVLRLDVSHADKGILPPVQLVAAENSENSTEDADEESRAMQQTSPIQQTNPTEIDNLDLSIEPYYVEANPGDTVNYTVTINWTPSEWRNSLRFCGTLSAAGFQKSFDFQSKPSEAPPIENEVPVTLPESIPPFNYSLNLTVNSGSQKASDETTLKVNSSTTAITPGFESTLAVIGLITGSLLFLTKKRR